MKNLQFAYVTRPLYKSQPHEGHLTTKLNYRRFPSHLLCTFLLFSFHLLPSLVHPAGFSFCFFRGFLVVFILFSSNNNNNLCDTASDFCGHWKLRLQSEEIYPYNYLRHYNLNNKLYHLYLK